jgi:hypothetical protein
MMTLFLFVQKNNAIVQLLRKYNLKMGKDAHDSLKAYIAAKEPQT